MPEVFAARFFSLWPKTCRPVADTRRKLLVAREKKPLVPRVFRTMLGFLADAAIHSDARKITLLKYGIKELKTKNFVLAMLIHVRLRPKEIVLWHIKDKVIMLL